MPPDPELRKLFNDLEHNTSELVKAEAKTRFAATDAMHSSTKFKDFRDALDEEKRLWEERQKIVAEIMRRRAH